MDKIFVVIGSEHGYSKTLYGIYADISLAENRQSELLKYGHLDVVEIKEISLNTEIEVDF